MRYRFADCVLDPDRRELHRGGARVELQPKALSLLLFLIENRERAVSKNELLDALWPDVTVGEGSLTRAVNLVRRATGDEGGEDGVIVTVRGHGYRVGVDVSVDDPAPAAAAARPREAVLVRPAVAVLPFRNLSGDPEQEYLADGITEDLITALAGWRWFPVIARDSVFSFKGQQEDVVSVARALRARYVVQGSVRRAGERIRITARLADASQGHEIWSKAYDREVRDVFELQDEITERIVAGVEPELSRSEVGRALRQKPESLDSWDCSLRALWHVRRGTRDDYTEANRLLARALELEPTSSYAHSMLALCRFEEALLGTREDAVYAFEETRRAAENAVALDDADWLAHALLGIACLWTDRDYDQAVAEEERAIALNPSAAISDQFLGCVLEFGGRPSEALAHLETVLRLNPRYQSTSLILSDMALCQLLLGAPQEAVALASRAIREQAHNVRAHQRLVAALAHAGRRSEARAALAELERRQPGFSLAYVEATYPFRDPRDLAHFVAGLRAAGWRAGAPRRVAS